MGKLFFSISYKLKLKLIKFNFDMISPRSLCLRSLVIVPLKRLSSDSKAIQEFELYQRVPSESLSNDTERYGSDFDATPKRFRPETKQIENALLWPNLADDGPHTTRKVYSVDYR